MGQMRERIDEAKAEKRRFSPGRPEHADDRRRRRHHRRRRARDQRPLYGTYGLRRVYYSAFSPIPEPSAVLPLKPPPLQRENRLYQADWLLRFYGFSVDEIAAGGEDGMLDLDADPEARLGAEASRPASRST